MTKNEEQVIFLIKDIVANKFNRDIPQDFLDMKISSLELDSLELLTLVVELETSLMVKLEDQIFYQSPTIKQIVSEMAKQMEK